MDCASCGRRNERGAARCGGCGALLPPSHEGQSWADAATDAAPTAFPRGHTQSGRLQPGTRLGSRYEILSMLGEGGMGSVYKARDLELERMVALKVIRPDLVSHPAVLDRFKREILLASQVTHRNVLRIHDLGEAGDVRFISMQFVEGQNLHQALKKDGPMDLERGLPIARQIAEALQAAHDAGVVHRDLKPQNILLDAQGTAYIADFGISRSLESDGSMTDTGAVIGTVDYMSPEQARGETVDHRSDIYSLGVIFYELFTGSLPFKGSSSLSVMMKRLTEDAPTLRSARPQIPLWLSALVHRAMQRDPEARYQHVRDLLRDLERQRASIAWKRTLRRKAPMAAGIVLALAAAVTGGVALWRSRPAPGPPAMVKARTSLALVPFVNETNDPEYDWASTGLPEMLRADLQQFPELNLIGEDRVLEVVRALRMEGAGLSRREGVARIAARTNAEHILTGNLILLGDTFRIQASLSVQGAPSAIALDVEGKGEESLPAMAGSLARRLQKELHLSGGPGRPGSGGRAAGITTDSVPALKAWSLGLDLARSGNDLGAVPRFEEAIAADPGFALAHAQLAEAYDRLGYGDKAVAAADRAAEGIARVSAAEAAVIRGTRARVAGDPASAVKAYQELTSLMPNNAEAFLDLAEALEDNGDLEAAEKALRRVAELDEKHPRALYALGRVLAKRGDLPEALIRLNLLAELHRESGNDEGLATALNGLGMATRMQGRNDEALRHYEASLAIRRRLDDRRGVATALRNIALIRTDMGSYDDAVGSARESLRITGEIGDATGRAESYLMLGDIHQGAGRAAEALEAYRESLKIVRDLGDPSLMARTYSALGYINSVLGRYVESETFMQEALARRRAIGDKGELLRALIDLGAVEQLQGRYEKGIAYALEARDIAREIGEKAGELVVSANLATIHEDQGEYGSALALLAEAEGSARRMDDTVLLATVLAYTGSVKVRLGDADGARAALAEALPMARGAEALPILAEALMAEGERLRASGQAAQGEALHREAVQVAGQAQDLWLTLRARQRLAESSGDRKAMASVAAEAASAGLEPVRGWARLGLARAAAAAGRPEEAVAEAAEAARAAAPLRQKDLLFQACHVSGAALSALGRTTEAQEQFRRGLELLEEMRAGLAGEPLQRFMARPLTTAFLRDASRALPDDPSVKGFQAENL